MNDEGNVMNDEYKAMYTKVYDMEQWNQVGEWDSLEEEEKWVAPRYNYQEMLINLMLYLKSTGGLEFAILKDPELGKWWANKVKKIEKIEKKNAALEKLKSSMTDEELKILGIKL